MKKLGIVLLAAGLIAGVGFSSCKKCSTCIAKDKTSGTQVATSGEFCGNASYVDDTEQAFKDTWGIAYDVTCE